MNEPLDEAYLRWLYSQVASVKFKNPSRTYWSLLRQLFRKEFVWFVPNDDNRVEDGRQLRYDFIDQVDVEVDQDWLELGCSMLELLIGLSQRLSFEADGEPRGWFWILIENLGLETYNDHVKVPEEKVDEILNDVIWRTYSPNGTGGLFPLKRPSKDQRDVEIWMQLHAYLLEMD